MRLRRVILRCMIYYAAFCILLAVFLGELAFHPQRIPIERQTAQRIVAGSDAVLEDVSVTAEDGTRLSAWFSHPVQGNGDAVILLHGISDTRQGMSGLAKMFLSHGYAVLMPDSRGHGESGGFPTYGIKEVGDVQRWVDWLDHRYHPGCVYGLGESMGAAIILQATPSVPFSAVVAESPFASFREIAYIRVGQFFGSGSWVGRIALRPAVELAFPYGWVTRGVFLLEVSPERSVMGSQVPVLLIHGLADTSIPFQQSERIAAGNPAAIQLWLVPDAGHTGAFCAAGREFERRVIDWFASHRADSLAR